MLYTCCTLYEKNKIMSKDKEFLLNKMNEIIDKPGGKQAARFILNSLGSIPFAGGVFAASGAVWGEKEQQEFNEVLTEWAGKTDSELKGIWDKLEYLLNTATKPKMTLLIGEIIGNENAEKFLSKSGNQIPLILNNQTVNELESFIQNKWLTITSTSFMVSMGVGNRVGTHFEELKRPYGMGAGFVLTVNDSYFDN